MFVATKNKRSQLLDRPAGAPVVEELTVRLDDEGLTLELPEPDLVLSLEDEGLTYTLDDDEQLELDDGELTTVEDCD